MMLTQCWNVTQYMVEMRWNRRSNLIAVVTQHLFEMDHAQSLLSLLSLICQHFALANHISHWVTRTLLSYLKQIDIVCNKTANNMLSACSAFPSLSFESHIQSTLLPDSLVSLHCVLPPHSMIAALFVSVVSLPSSQLPFHSAFLVI